LLKSESLERKAYSIDSIRKLARSELPLPIFDYADGGAGDESTLRNNRFDFDKYSLIPQPLNGAGVRDLSLEIFGQRISLPVMIGPTGLSGLFWPDGESEIAKAAKAMGTGFCLSHGSVCTIEDIAAVDISPRWMQVFIYKDRGFTREFCERAYRSGFDALVLTIDNQIPGKRERDLVNGFTIPPNFSLQSYIKMFPKYKWLWRMRSALRHITFGNYTRLGEVEELSVLASRMADLLDPQMDWSDVEWLRKIWKRPLLIKGILHPDDATKALDLGVDGVIVSNHGGRQLDGVVSSILALEEIVARIEAKIPIFLDGGIRRGSDVIKAIALGADACLIGRPQLWGVAIGGQAGVEKVLTILREEIDMAMALCGVSSIPEISRQLIYDLK